MLLAGIVAGASIAVADDATDQDATLGSRPLRHVVEGINTHARALWGQADEIADSLGLDLGELRDRIRDGATLEDLATEAGIDLDAALETIRERITAEIDERVASGSLSEAQADQLRERIESFELDQLPTPGELGDMRDRFHRGMPFSGRDWMGDLDLDFDIDFGELRDRIESGMSLEEALEDLGVDVEATLAEARAAALEKIDELVADGVLTKERAAQLEEMIEGFSFEDGFRVGRGSHFGFDGERPDGGALRDDVGRVDENRGLGSGADVLLET